MLFLFLLATVGIEYRATVHAVPTWPMIIQPARALEHKRWSPIRSSPLNEQFCFLSYNHIQKLCHIACRPLSNYEQCHLLLRRLKLIFIAYKRFNSSSLRASSVSNKRTHWWLLPREIAGSLSWEAYRTDIYSMVVKWRNSILKLVVHIETTLL